MRSNVVYLTDMSLCIPKSALTRSWKDGYWLLIDYEAAKGMKGTMIYYGTKGFFHETVVEPPQITYPLNLEGWHAIYLGIHYQAENLSLKAKLSEDRTFHTIGKEKCLPKDGSFPEKMSFKPFELAETFWRYADLRGQSIIFAYPSGSECISNVAYVKLVRLSRSQVAELKAEEPRLDTRRLIGIYDGGGAFKIRDEEGIREYLEPFRGGDFKIILWGGALGDLCNYPTKVGEDRSRTDSLGIAVEYAHEIRLQIYGSIRMEGPSLHAHMPFHEFTGGRFVLSHPELRSVDAGGKPTNHLSLAYPEVREHWVAILREMAQRGVDGVHVIFTRCHPFILYENPVVESFIANHNEDPRSLSPRDERWLRHKAEYVTQFLREIRTMLDEVGRERDERLGTAYHIMNSIENSLYFNLDVATWVKEGLANHLVAHPCFSADPNIPTHWEVEPCFTSEFARITRGTGCMIYADVYPRRMPAENYRLKAIQYYEAGADGLCFWDTDSRTPRSSEWYIITRLGHINDLRSWSHKTSNLFKVRTIETINQMTTDGKYSFTDG